MRSCDVLVVGGGPAGSTAAWRLCRDGADVIVLDQEAFPRLKLCAGWITPEVLRDLRFDPADYPHRFMTFEHLRVHFRGLQFRVRCTQHSIRRYEFDAWLLERSGAPLLRHRVREIRRDGEDWIIDESFRCRYLIGAGGTRCPVYRQLFRGHHTRARELQAATLEHEFPYDWHDGDCHLWFFERGLPGYAWYVPKANGFLNVGIGGMAQRLKGSADDIQAHWSRFTTMLEQGLVRGGDWRASGYSYYLHAPGGTGRIGNAFITGDAAGLATRDLCEGIGPAVRSGLRAAEAILHGSPYELDGLTGSSLGGGLASRLLAWGFTRGAP